MLRAGSGVLLRETGRRKRAAAAAALAKHAPAQTALLDEQRRLFHATRRTEVLPIIAAGIGIAIAATGLRYLIRAGKRMREIEAEEQAQRAANPTTPDPNIDASQFAGSAVAGPAFGLDFGTISMRLGVCEGEGKGPEVVENREGSRWTPAVVSYSMAGGDPVVGQLAKAQRWQMPQATMLGVQPFIGLKFGSSAVEQLSGKVKFSLVDVGGAPVQLGKVASDMLANMAALKEHKVGPGGAVVLSAPPHFDGAQRSTLSAVGTAAGFTVAGTVEEPVAAAAAALHMGLLPEEARDGVIAVVDVGGRTMSCSLVDLGCGAPIGGKLIASLSSNAVGGEYIEELLVAELNSDFKKKNKGLDLLQDPLSLTRLYEAAEAAKVELSKSQATSINLPFITADMTGPKHLEMDLSRAQFERFIDPHMAVAAQPCRDVLEQAGLSTDAVKAVLLVGGCSRIPAVQALAASVFKQTPIVATHSEELVVLGASLAARREVYGG